MLFFDHAKLKKCRRRLYSTLPTYPPENTTSYDQPRIVYQIDSHPERASLSLTSTIASSNNYHLFVTKHDIKVLVSVIRFLFTLAHYPLL